MSEQPAETGLTATQETYNVAKYEMFQLAAYGHHRYHPLVESLTDEGKRQERDYNDRLLKARDDLESGLLRLIAEYAEVFAGRRMVSVDWLRALADDPGELALLAIRPDERDEVDGERPALAPPVDPAALRDRIIEALLTPRYGGPQHNTPGGLPLTATPEEARRHRAGQIADVVLPLLSPPAVQRADRIVAYTPAAGRPGNGLHCQRCTPPPRGDLWTPVTAEELEDGGVCTTCGGDVLID